MKKSLKRIGCAVVALTLGLAMSFTVMAEGSVKVAGTGKATDASGKEIEMTMSESFSPEVKAEVDAVVNSIDKVKELLGDKFVEGMSVLAARDVSVPEGTEFPLDITFDITGIKSDSKVAILHYDTTAKEWEVIDAKAGENTITGTFKSLSPVVFVTDSKGAVTPPTGETAPIAAVSAIAILACAGMYFSMKLKKAC